MRIVFIFILSAFFTVKIVAQYNEFSIHLTSGLFSFGGTGAASSTLLYYYNPVNSHTENPYGRNSGFSYGAGFQAQRLTKSNYVLGFQICYESLSSKVRIYGIYGGYGYDVYDGKTILTHQFLNFQPYFGKRIKLLKQVKTDFTLGLDIGICLSYKEHAIANCAGGVKFEITKYELYQPIKFTKPIYDIRPRFQFINYYKKIGLTIGYSYGITNYTPISDSYNNKYYNNKEDRKFSRMIRIGLVYKI